MEIAFLGDSRLVENTAIIVPHKVITVVGTRIITYESPNMGPNVDKKSFGSRFRPSQIQRS